MSHAALVLAAGGSRRLGRAKQLLSRDGESLIHRAVRLAAQTGPQRLLVVLGAQAARLQAAIEDLPAELCLNPEWQHGLASSLQCGAAALAAHTGAVLILGCDQPALELEHLRTLLADAARARSGCAATRHGDAPGIPAVVSGELMAQARGLYGDRGFGALLARLPQQELAWLDAPALRWDIDVEADVAGAIAAGWLDPD
ncbi:nucleotidyltransferase family protein [Lysobacter sp. cf310]|uniref:nucleotidyltransferase family protein n=1 Tax=Lysobacter sp. cf310 TaxID=1761790 RepID=UPI0008F3A6D0|nr:nucleotidyltransferase family protein [Lysobacter sp. cf310]SFK51986.1 molybdenum cofactor cytidylyltransferase [Lysobacter sp. cf310]